MSGTAAETDLHASAFEELQATRRENEPGWLGTYRRAGLAKFRELGFPTVRDEEWRATNLAPLARRRFRVSTAADAVEAATDAHVDRMLFGHAFQGHEIVFVNGRYQPELSSVTAGDAVEIASIAELLVRRPQLLQPHLDGRSESGGALAALNAAFLEDGAAVIVPPGVTLADPVHVVYLSSCCNPEPTVSHPRTLLLLGRGAQATVVESYGGVGGGAYWTNAVTDVVLEDGAVLDHYKVQREREDAFHVALMRVRQGRATTFTSNSLSLGGGLVRNDIAQVFEGEGGDCTLNGLFMADGRRHTDTHSVVDHAVPRCSSRELYKGILREQARGVFHGKIRVRQDAQKTDAVQVNKNLLLSEQALVHSTPALEIYADDVKCKHGSTTGQLDPNQLFYLRSRGLSEDQARSLLTYAFASDVVSRVRVEALRRGLTEHLQTLFRDPSTDIREAIV